MPDDPLAVQRAELEDFEVLINMLMSCAGRVHASVEMLAGAPQPMLEPLMQFYSQDERGSSIISRLCAQMSEFAAQAKRGEQQMQACQGVLRELSQRNSEVRATFQQRDVAHQTTVHYEKKVEALQEQIAKGGASTKVMEKLNRNVQKKRESEQHFAEVMKSAGVSTQDVLSSKWHRISPAISHLCGYYSMVFETAGQLVQGFAEVGQALVLQTTSEAMLRKGQELAAQAKQKLAGAANLAASAVAGVINGNNGAASSNATWTPGTQPSGPAAAQPGGSGCTASGGETHHFVPGARAAPSGEAGGYVPGTRVASPGSAWGGFGSGSNEPFVGGPWAAPAHRAPAPAAV
eukprot:CAMPEP_0171138744 /NCGR_PEP_ID=MMETSP0766_2-20121228/135614_1 /TAXON_ID=439317 /ORGANISM="Gambierdiscus australes, Strain CAWD 149" /LENGTH=347 /DNA_ID=CAMNT_0011602369 /DNA_START=44 /DNA_END=1084 /DNA_ORIENTATION=-